jgi:hypothetical protein
MTDCQIVAATAIEKVAVATCEICYESFNKSNHLQISCVYCTHGFCRTCVGQYLLSQQEQITCPNTECRMPWTEEFVDEHMYAVFRKGALGAHRQKFVLDREKSRLPELQARARRYKIAVDAMEGRLKQKLEHLQQYNAVPVVAALHQLEGAFAKKHMAYHDFAQRRWQVYKENWIRIPGQVPVRSVSLGFRVTQAEADAFETELLVKRKEKDAADVAIGKYKSENAAALAEAKRLYEAPAKAAATMPEYRQMADSYGDVVRLYQRDTRRIANYRRLFGEDAVEIVQGGEQVTVQTRQVVVLRGCPGEGCRGFLDDKWLCGVCDLSVCRHCHVGLGEDEVVEEHHGAAAGPGVPAEGSKMRLHICNPDQVATAKMLARDTKPCPKCKALISKIDGCDQMWCTQCQTPFSWITGQVEVGRVHNPHYYEWQRRNKGRSGALLGEPGDVMGEAQGGDCCAADLRLEELPFDDVDQVQNTTLFDNILVDVFEKIPEEAACEDATKIIRGFCANYLLVVYRKLVEIHEYHVRDRVNWNERYAQQKDNEDAIDYLVGRLSEVDWQRRVWSRDRARRFRNDCKEVKRMFYAAGRDILNSLTQGGGSIKVGETLKQIEALRTYANEAMMKAKKRYCLQMDPEAISLYHYVGYIPRSVDELVRLYTLFGQEYKAPTVYAGYFALERFLTLIGV